MNGHISFCSTFNNQKSSESCSSCVPYNGVWWKKIAEKRKERCKLHSMTRARNVKKTKSLTHLFMNRFQAHIYQCDTKCKNRETHTNKSTCKRHKDTTSLRKGTTDDVSTNKFTG